MTSELPLPADLQTRIASYAAYSPSPSGAAIRAYLDAHPWIEDMADAYPEMHLGATILGAPRLGLTDCSKCSRCQYARVYQFRRRYELKRRGPP